MKSEAETLCTAKRKKRSIVATRDGMFMPDDGTIAPKEWSETGDPSGAWADSFANNANTLKMLAALPTVKQGPCRIQTEEGALDAMRVYARESDPYVRAKIYARHINPVIARDGRGVSRIIAANALGTLGADLVIQRWLATLKFSFPIFKSIVSDFSTESAVLGKKIITRYNSAPTVNDYSTATGYASTSATATDVPITINKHKYAAIQFNANELGSTDRDLFSEQAEPQIYALGAQLMTDLLANVIEGASNFGTAGSQATIIANAAAFVRSAVTTVGTALNDRQALPNGRFMLLDDGLFNALADDTPLVFVPSNDPAKHVPGIALPRVNGILPHQAPYLPAGVVVNGTKTLHGFAADPTALALATRIPNSYFEAIRGANYGRFSIITDDDTGLSVCLVQYVNHDAGYSVQRVAIMYGTAVGNPAAGQLIAY